MSGSIGNNLRPAAVGTNLASSTSNQSGVDLQCMEAAVAHNDWDIMCHQAQLQQLARYQPGGVAGAGAGISTSGGGMMNSTNNVSVSLGMSIGSGGGMGGFGVTAGADGAILQQQILAAQSRERTLNSMMSNSIPYTNNNTGMHPNPLLNTVRDPHRCKAIGMDICISRLHVVLRYFCSPARWLASFFRLCLPRTEPIGKRHQAFTRRSGSAATPAAQPSSFGRATTAASANACATFIQRSAAHRRTPATTSARAA